MPSSSPALSDVLNSLIIGLSVSPPEKMAASRLVIVGNSRLNSELLHHYFSQHCGLEVAAIELSGCDGVAAVARSKPELVIVSLPLDDMCATMLVSQLHSVAPGARIILHTSQCNEYLIHSLGTTEWHGLLLDADEGLRGLGKAIEQVRQGIRFVSPRIAQCQAALRAKPNAFPKLLSKRLLDVLICITHSMSNDEIGARLGISASTALSHRKKIMSKLDIHSTPQLIRYCLEKGFHSDPPPVREEIAITP
jgi:DNA-binding NarL/FixJ family response regulator